MDAQTRKSLKQLAQSLNWEPAQTVIIEMDEEMDYTLLHVQSSLGDWWLINGMCGYGITDTDPTDEDSYSGDFRVCEKTARKYYKQALNIYKKREEQ